jgi:hypothetical protein
LAANLHSVIATTPTGGQLKSREKKEMKSKKNAKTLKKVKKIEATKNLNWVAPHH